ncbi:MAG: methyltransferase [Alphaproteobacteria bacterium]
MQPVRNEVPKNAPKPSPEKIMQLGFAFWGSKTLLSAVELGVFTELAKGPQKFSDISKKLGLHPRSALDFMDALVSLGMLNREGDVYSNTVDANIFLDRAKPSYMGGILEMANARLYPFWGRLTDGLRTGELQNEARDGKAGLFDELYKDPARLKQFLQAMTGISIGAGMVIGQKFPWKDYKTFIDVGGAQGGCTAQIALANPHLTGGCFDLPLVGPIFTEYAATMGLSNRLKFYPGDFFKDELPKADVVVMGHILHDWDLAEKKMLLKKAYDALPKGGALIVYEALIDDDRRENAFGLMMSLNMLIETRGGFDFTGKDCTGWMREAGFREMRVEHLVGPDSMVVGIK